MHNSAQLRCFENGNDDFGVEAFWIGDASRVGHFVPLNGPLNGHPPSYNCRGIHETDIHPLRSVVQLCCTMSCTACTYTFRKTTNMIAFSPSETIFVGQSIPPPSCSIMFVLLHSRCHLLYVHVFIGVFVWAALILSSP